jgi:hypothetical protein
MTVSLLGSWSSNSNRACICKRLRSPGIDSEELIPPAYIALRTGIGIGIGTTKGLSYRPARQEFLGSLKRFTNTGSEARIHDYV